MRSVDEDIFSVIEKEFRVSPPARLGLAVSGGGDSVALMHAFARYFAGSTTELFAVTVDHGLRKAASEEAGLAGQIASDLGISHDVVAWSGWDGKGNLQDRARAARYQLMTNWAAERGISVLALGHTRDDQAETVLMRLSRSAGVDGLSGIPRRRMVEGVTLIRPFLDISRARLRSYLKSHGVPWADDPSNEDTRFHRVRMRKAAPVLEELGLTSQALADVACHMTHVREALDWYTFVAAREMVQLDAGDILIDLRPFRTLPDEIARRLLVLSLRWVGGTQDQPRRDAVRDAMAAIRAGKTTTLHGCMLLAHGGLVWITREFNAVRGVEARLGQLWDRRWCVSSGGKCDDTLRVRALGRSGLSQCGDWRQTGRPYPALLSSPSVWKGGTVIAAPRAGLDGPVEIELIGSGEEFFASILSH